MPEPVRSGSSAVPSHTQPNRSGYLTSAVLLLGLCFVPWKALISLSLNDNQYTHILFGAVHCGRLIYLDRGKIFGNVKYCGRLGIPLGVMGIALCGAVQIAPSISASSYYLSELTIGGIVTLRGGFPHVFRCPRPLSRSFSVYFSAADDTRPQTV